MNDRYGAMFERLRTKDEGAFGAFVMLGDPDLGAEQVRMLQRTISECGVSR